LPYKLVSQWLKTPWRGASSSSRPPNYSWSQAPTLSTSSRSLHRALGADPCRVKSSPLARSLTQDPLAVGPPPQPSVLLTSGSLSCPGPLSPPPRCTHSDPVP
ncbi:unnamed protein product, partial [Gulo gulo]